MTYAVAVPLDVLHRELSAVRGEMSLRVALTFVVARNGSSILADATTIAPETSRCANPAGCPAYPEHGDTFSPRG